MTLAAEIARALGFIPITIRDDVENPRVRVEGIVTGAAYAALETFGQPFEIPGVTTTPGGSFGIATAVFYDYDDEGLGKVLHLFRTRPVVAADNATWTLADSETAKWIGKITFTVFDDHTSGQVSMAQPALKLRCGPGRTSIWGCFQTQGTDNIAAGAIPEVELTLMRD